MKRVPACFLLLIFFAACKEDSSQSSGRVYFFSRKGNDSSAGTKEKPWQSLTKLQNLTLKPGDTVYFSGGDTLDGTIVIDSADFGAANQPLVITSYGNTNAVIRSNNLSGLTADKTKHLVISNISFVGAGRKTGNTSNGVGISHSNNIKLDNLEISGYQKCGLLVYHSKEVDIDHITAIHNGAAGIEVGGDQDKNDCRDIRIRNSKAIDNPGDPTNFDNHSGNGIIVGRCRNVLIEYCMATNNGWDMPRVGNGPVGIWAWEADSVTIQHCISFRNKTAKGAADGGGFDLDGGVTNSVIQYCLSYENEGAGFGIFQYAGASKWYNNTIRYNISENDGNVSNAQASIYIWNGSRDEKQMKDGYFHNNIIYNARGAAIGYAPENEQTGFQFYDNVFVAKDEFIRGQELNGKFSNNNWWSLGGKQKPVKDSTALSIDPGFKNAGNTTLVSPALLEAFTGYGKFFSDSVIPVASIKPGRVWKDTDGNFINAHGGGMLFHNGKYYWYG